MAKQDDEKDDQDKSKKKPKLNKKAYIKPAFLSGGSLLSLQSTTFATTPPIG